MTRRIMLAILGVASLAVLAFGIPLALATQQAEQNAAIASLQREAVRVAVDTPQDLRGTEPVKVPHPRDADDVRFAIYDANGQKVKGYGPAKADSVVRAALDGRLSHYRDAHQISVGWPLTVNEKTYGAVRAGLPEHVVEDKVRQEWAIMVVLGVLVVAGSAFAAWRLARRLAEPVDDLAAAVTQLGQQDFTVRVAPSGVPELDRAGEAVDATADRLGRLLARERSFSADASHQLRTPLTGLRLVLESAAASEADPRPQLDQALAQVDRLEATVDDMLRLAREERPASEPADPTPVLGEVASAWRAPVAKADRQLRLRVPPELPVVRMSAAALRQILDVLVGNALQHGAGTIGLSAEPTPGGVSVEVSDQGPGSPLGVNEVFSRGTGTGSGHGIGLALARSLAEAEGARLTLKAAGPNPVFRLLIPV